MNSPENQIIVQYAILRDKVIEFENEIKTKKAKIDQEINKIEAYNNIFLQNEKDGSSSLSQTEKNSESILRVAPILEPSFINGFDHTPPPIQMHNESIKKTSQFEIKFLATQPITKNISLLDIHTFNDTICVGSDGLLRIYSIIDGSVNFDWDFSVDSCQNNITCIANIQNSQCFVVGFEDGFVRILNTSRIVVSEFPVSTEPLSTIFYSTKKILYCYAKNGEISCWKGENNCMHSNIFEENIIYFKEIEDDPSNDIYLITQSFSMYRWETQNNEFILIEENVDSDFQSGSLEKKFTISPEEKEIKIIPLEMEDESSILSLEVPEYSLFDKSGSYFCFSLGKRFSIYKILVRNLNRRLPYGGNLAAATGLTVTPKSNHDENKETTSSLSIDSYMIGNVDQSSIKNQPNE